MKNVRRSQPKIQWVFILDSVKHMWVSLSVLQSALIDVVDSSRSQLLNKIGIFKYFLKFRGQKLVLESFFQWHFKKNIFGKHFLENISRRFLNWGRSFLFLINFEFRGSLTEVNLGHDALEICSKFTGEHSCQSVISVFNAMICCLEW